MKWNPWYVEEKLTEGGKLLGLLWVYSIAVVNKEEIKEKGKGGVKKDILESTTIGRRLLHQHWLKQEATFGEQTGRDDLFSSPSNASQVHDASFSFHFLFSYVSTDLNSEEQSRAPEELYPQTWC